MQTRRRNNRIPAALPVSGDDNARGFDKHQGLR